MKYTSTRDSSVRVDSAYAIAHGISPDGGLFVPVEIPRYDYKDLCTTVKADYRERAADILSRYLTDFPIDELRECTYAAYTDKFGDDEVAPVVSINNFRYMLELWHGPTSAFKDMALQLLPQLLTRAAAKIGSDKEIVILVATSGDTGKAALEGFADVPGTRIIVFYPEDGVSNVQKLQMTTQLGSNVQVCAVRGNFDDAQNGVKRIFTDRAFAAELEANGMAFSSANSINWGRLVPQIVYYINSYLELMENGEMDYEGERVNIVVPTGNFGNILAAFYAREMGLPIKRLICASNANDVLTEFIRTGVYDRNRVFHTTISPSMDILISSNLERLIYHLSGCDSARVAEWMRQLNTTGRYAIDSDMLTKLNKIFWAGSCDDAATKAKIREMFDSERYLCDTHTAVALNVYQQYVDATGDDRTPAIIASTANPFKFSPSVLDAVSGVDPNREEFDMISELSVMTGWQIPENLAALRHMDVRFDRVCNKDEMESVVREMLGL